MTEREYNAAEGIRRSDLWRMHESPEKFRWFLEHPEPATPALVFGSAVHKLLLEPESFDEEYAVAPNVDRRTKAGKEEWERILSAAGERVLLSADDAETIRSMVKKANSIPYVQDLLRGEHEKPFFWEDPDTGITCKARVDILTQADGKVLIGDYKTTTDARTDIFVNRDMQRYGYTLQAFMYTEGAMRCLGLDYRPDFVFLVQEKKAPYAMNAVMVCGDSDVMMYGQDQFREYIGTLKQCMETGYWFGYTGLFGEPNEAYLPGFVQMGEEEE